MQGNITISRVTSNHGPDTVVVRIKVGRDVHHATLSLQDYAMAMTGMSDVPVEYEHRIIGGKPSHE